jgi:branched-chain amino acid transport system substrate-binding protein
VGLYTPYFYDGVMVIAAAMKAANSTDPAKYLPALAKIEYPGVTADIQFDGNGDLTRGLLTIFQVRNGKWVVVPG